ncbi:MAG: ABC transporter substrate-binding protein [Bacteroidales bacterium]
MNKSLFLIPLISLVSCGVANRQTEAVGDKYHVKYAKGFEVESFENYTLVKIRNPWDTTLLLQKYILIDRNKEVPSHLPAGTIVRTPLERVVAYGSTHCSALDELEKIQQIVGVCESRYIDIPYIQNGVKNGTILDLGEATAPDVEKLIELNAEAIMTSPFQNVGYGRVGKCGIPLIECADYMEATPLGRAEWIRFHALFYQEEKRADSIFSETESAYLNVKDLALNAKHRPTLLTERKNGPSWYVPGGNSYMANLYKDAGVHYIWEENQEAGSLPLSAEEVLDKAGEADFWLIKYNSKSPLTYGQMKDDYALNAQFDAWKNRNIYVANTGEVPFYEEMPLHPDRLLKDLVSIFHPELMPGYETRYFSKMKE